LSKLQEKGWVVTKPDRQVMLLPNLLQMNQLLNRSAS